MMTTIITRIITIATGDHHHPHHHYHHEDYDHGEGGVRMYRNFTIKSMLEQAEGLPLPLPVRTKSMAVFHRLAEAEAATHGMDMEKVSGSGGRRILVTSPDLPLLCGPSPQVHYHEVGAVDGSIDTVGVVLAPHLLRVGWRRSIAPPCPGVR